MFNDIGLDKHYDFTQYAHDNNVNVIPEEDFKRLTNETFKCISDILRNTYGPYGSLVTIACDNETTTTKDGYNVFNAVGFSHMYKRKVYLMIKEIIDRVNKHVGDGTTSCILLGEKMFRSIEKNTTTPDDKRNILSVLSEFENMLQKHDTVIENRNDHMVHWLTTESLYGLISMAGNYDERLVDVLVEALQPETAENSNVVTHVRNVVVEPKIDQDEETGTSFEVDYLPGDYRIRVNMDTEFGLTFEDPRKVRVAIYDHAFSASDWNFFMQNFDKVTETLIIARGFNRSFMDHEYTKYLRDMGFVHAAPKIIMAEIKGDYLRDEISDLCAVLKTEPIGLHAQAVEHEKLPFIPVQVYKGNCMCFEMEEVPTRYIEALKLEMDADLSKSMIKHQLYKERIQALSNTAQDTMITVKASSPLELKMLVDKIDDCLSIVKSAIEYGTVPNMLVYGYTRIKHYIEQSDDPQVETVGKDIMESIKGLFYDIWHSKHGDLQKDKADAIANELYDDNGSSYNSFDIIRERYAAIDELPTSAQYDLEVIAAGIAIVKYLLTSRAMIFDANILKPVDDTGKLMPLGEN